MVETLGLQERNHVFASVGGFHYGGDSGFEDGIQFSVYGDSGALAQKFRRKADLLRDSEDKLRREDRAWKFVVRDVTFFHWVPIQQGWAKPVDGK